MKQIIIFIYLFSLKKKETSVNISFFTNNINKNNNIFKNILITPFIIINKYTDIYPYKITFLP